MSDLEPLRRLLDAAEAAAPVDAVLAVTREVGVRLDAAAISLLVADTSGRALVRLAHIRLDGTRSPDAAPAHRTGHGAEAEESALVVPFDGGPLERVVRSQRAEVLAPETRSPSSLWTVLAPVTDRGEVGGVLELLLPREPSKEDVTEIASLAHLLAFVLIANLRHTDLFEWAQRSRPLSLSAEIQRRLLPGSRTCEAGSLTLSAWLEPASEIAGDTFDYALARDVLHLSITDAMGHGVAAALTATLCVSALRGARRAGLTVTEQAGSANRAVVQHSAASGLDDFVTGLLGRVDLRTGVLTMVNAGHVAPYLARGGAVTMLQLPPSLPFGLFADTAYEVAEVRLKPGDRLVLVTDGMLERNAAAIDLPAAILAAASLHPREATASLADSVVTASGDLLSDDATVLCLDWYAGHGRDRDTEAGADVSRASSPER